MFKRFAPRAALSALVLGAAGAANAAVPEGVLTAITTAGTDGVTVGVAVLVAIVGIFALKLMRRAL